jgi:hypothetical protein
MKEKKQDKTEMALLKAVGKYIRYHGGYAPIVGPIKVAQMKKITYELRIEFLGRPPVKVVKE